MDTSHKRHHEDTPPYHISKVSAPTPHQIWQSPSPIEDRESTFLAYFSPTMDPQALRKHLKSQDQIGTATHHVLAWRTPVPQSKTLAAHFEPKPQPDSVITSGHPQPMETGSDDDGETDGGERVLKVLEAEGVEGALVMARWFGGVLLGPIRFDHMEQIARAAIQKKARVVKELKQRDSNIAVLRGLLKEKHESLEKTKNEGGKEGGQLPLPVAPPSPQAKKTNYAAMDLDALRRMDKARDSTVLFLLKRIEEAKEAERRTAQKDHDSSAAPKGYEAGRDITGAKASGDT